MEVGFYENIVNRISKLTKMRPVFRRYPCESDIVASFVSNWDVEILEGKWVFSRQDLDNIPNIDIEAMFTNLLLRDFIDSPDNVWFRKSTCAYVPEAVDLISGSFDELELKLTLRGV